MNRTFSLEYSPNNVVSYNDGLGLITRAGATNNIISSAEIDSKRGDILYGTFRMRATVPTVPGVCMGFFSYYQNSDGTGVQETDIEFLSSDPLYYETIHYTNQPGTVNGVVDTNAYKIATVNADLTYVSHFPLGYECFTTQEYLPSFQSVHSIITVGTGCLHQPLSSSTAFRLQ